MTVLLQPRWKSAISSLAVTAVFRIDTATTTALTTYITSDDVRTSALVRVSHDIFGSGTYLYSTTDYCSIHVPGNAQAIVSVSNFDATASSPECEQRFELSQWNSSQTYQLCRCVTLLGVYTV